MEYPETSTSLTEIACLSLRRIYVTFVLVGELSFLLIAQQHSSKADATLPSSTTTPPVPTAAMMKDQALTFTPFPKLPIELRFKIWEYFNQSEPRYVEVKILPPAINDLTWSVPKFQSLTPTPVILHVCHEGRQVGLKRYEKVSRTSDEDGEEEG